MRDTQRNLITGLLTAAISIVILWGSLTLAIAEDQDAVASVPSATFTPSKSATASQTSSPAPTQIPGEATYTASATEPPTNTPSSTNTPTIEPTQAPSCPYPDGWIEITIETNDTLDSLANRYNTTANALREGNCLLVDSLAPGSRLYVPQIQITNTATYIPCGPPGGWVNYVVKSGDTLFQIGLAHNVTVAQLQQANCLGSSTYIQAGQTIYVPFIATLTSTATSTPSPTLSQTATETAIPPTPTSTFTATAPPPTNTATQTQTETIAPSPTSTYTDTATIAPTSTQTPSLTLSPSPTSITGP